MSQSETAENPQANLRALKYELAQLIGLGIILLGAISFLLVVNWQWQRAAHWFIQTLLLWLFIAYQSTKRLELNRPDKGSPLYGNLGWGNRLTLLRALLIAATGGFLFQPWPEGPLLSWVPGMIYFFGAVLDRVDGLVARRTGQISLLGTELDTVTDAVGLAVASLLAVSYGQTHWSFLFMGIAYYAYHGGIIWRNKNGLPVYPLPPAMHRRVWAGFQMGYLVVALWPLYHPPLTLIGGFAFMLPALIGFIIDWLIVSGRINRNAEHVDQWFRRLTDFSQTIFQPALRILIVILLSVSIATSGFPPMSNSGVQWFSSVATAGFVLTSITVLLGFAGRYFALLLLGLLGWYYTGNEMLLVDYILFCCVVWSLLLGSGRFSLWQEDDHWLNRYDGA